MMTNKGEQKQNKRQGNWAVVFMAIVVVMIFAGMMGYIWFYAQNNRQEMMDNSYNTHQSVLAKQNSRGTIMSADGEVLAKTETTSDGTEKRVYPFANLFSHVVGFSTHGKSGIESEYNYYLINSNAAISEKVSNELEGNKAPGDIVYTTLNTKIQKAADDVMGIYRGAIILTDVKTGAILCMISKPDYDPNEIPVIWDSLLADNSSTVLLNRATQGLYPPGSTFKIITALEYMRENPDTYESYHFSCNGSFTADGNTIRCYHGSSHGSVGFTKSFAKSCNSSFANMSVTFDRNAYADTLESLLFNQALPVGMKSAISHAEMNSESTIDDLMQTSIGQGQDTMSPLHLNMITQAIANDGMMMKPYNVTEVKSVNGAVVKKYNPTQLGQVVTEEEAKELRALMAEVVSSGTATKLSGLSYTAAGKTGSAEYNSHGDSHAWFTGFAPAEDPEVCVTVIIEGAGSGGDYAVPMARRVLDAYFEQ